MPSAAETNQTVTRQPEKPNHYTYLKSFRTEQCKDFLNHRCGQHRPFTCFFWHFPNQRRRRPALNSKDGTFNYSPEVYCSTYDESTGICPQGDSCPFLHRNIGDTEKRYHLRYYKTERCIIDTENKGSCTKNGPHCAFAHGADDIRAPVFDINERSGPNTKSSEQHVDLEVNGDREKDKVPNIDPVWYDETYIKRHYKTEPCLRTSRHVTLSCPFYHNARDRRRSYDICKYRAVVCPNVRHKEEWTDPSECELGDKCPYIHTRTEQQYHPDIYKTDKCHEEATNGRCSKGIFCAFAHDNTMMPPVSPARAISLIGENSTSNNASQSEIDVPSGASRIKHPVNGNSTLSMAVGNGFMPPSNNSENSPDIDRNWLGFTSLKLDSRIGEGDIQSRMKSVIASAAPDVSPFSDTAKRTEFLPFYGSFPNIASKPMPPSMLAKYNSNAGSGESSFKGSLVLPSGTESNLLDSLDSLEDDNEHALLSVSCSEMTTNPQLSFLSSAPVGASPSLFNSFNPTMGLGVTTSGLNSSSNLCYTRSIQGFVPSNGGYAAAPTSRLAMYGLSLQPSEVDKLRTELTEAKEIIKNLNEEKLQAVKEKEALLQCHQASLSESQVLTNGGSYLRCLVPTANLESLAVPHLQEIQSQIQMDLRRLQMLMARKACGKCLSCLDQIATTLLPCKHKSLCEPCLLIAKNCPLCGSSIPDQQQF